MTYELAKSYDSFTLRRVLESGIEAVPCVSMGIRALEAERTGRVAEIKKAIANLETAKQFSLSDETHLGINCALKILRTVVEKDEGKT